MATSGTSGTLTISVQELIDDAHRMCFVPPQALTEEQLAFARRQLGLMLSAWANKGYNLYTIEIALIGQSVGKRAYSLPSGTINVLNLQRRNVVTQGTAGGASSAGGTVANAFDGDLTTVCTQTSADGNLSYDFGDTVTVTTAAYSSSGAATLDLIWESSTDNSTWSTVLDTASRSYPYKELIWYDFNAPIAGRYFRVRETGGATLATRQVVFGRSPTDTSISRQNRDDYAGQVDRTVQGDPTSYWYDRQIDPQVYVWPASRSNFDALVAWVTKQIEDVGAYTNTISVPQRWQDAVQFELAARVSLNLQGVDPTRRNELRQLAQEAFMAASDEEQDRSDLFLTPEIGGYSGAY